MSVDVLAELRREAGELKKRLKTVMAAIKILGWTSDTTTGRGKKRKRMSASARERIGKAQRARWAKIRAAKKSAG
jgi:hypothetical protein